MANILIVDDDKEFSQTLSLHIENNGHRVYSAFLVEDALAQAQTQPFDIIFLDVRLPDGNGLDILPQLQQLPSKPEIIIITGAGESSGAELAMKYGAWDYLQKGASIRDITLPLQRALEYRKEKYSHNPLVALKREEIIGNSLQINFCLDIVALAASSDANVLITGETGTGKELFARAIHNNSSQANRNFVVVDCAALPESLIESTLFGHERGSFTGASFTKIGLVKQADGGTLFLDEVGELPHELQKSFLRVLQEKKFRPVGSHQEVESDFRLIAATNRNLEEMAKAGKFRTDLLYRLNSFHIELPPLRERKEDIQEIIIHHIAKLSKRYKIENKGFSSDFIETLLEYPWPGNVRELINTLDRTFAVAINEPTLYPKHLPPHIRIEITKASIHKQQASDYEEDSETEESAVTADFESDHFPSLKEIRERTEKSYIADLMAYTKGDVKQACQISGLSKSRLYSLLQKYNIKSKMISGDN